jgi:hypothetical protein
MIKLLLKYLIFESCLNKFFDTLLTNFPNLTFDVSELKEGNFINVSIIINGNNIKLTGCKVISVENGIAELEYTGFNSPITLIAENGHLIDVRGDYRTFADNFIKGML